MESILLAIDPRDPLWIAIAFAFGFAVKLAGLLVKIGDQGGPVMLPDNIDNRLGQVMFFCQIFSRFHVSDNHMS